MTLPFGETIETILLVEDHSAVLKVVKQVLEDANFSVIPAKNAKEAIHLEAAFPGTIDLLLSDVRMSGMSGPELARKLQERRPQMRVMLMSGYPGSSLVLDYGWHYIDKPFIPSVLVGNIRDVLHGGRREPPAGRFPGLKKNRRPLGRATLHRPEGSSWRGRRRA